MMNEYDLGHVMLSLWFPTLAVQNYFFTENVSILMSFVKEDADVDYISLDLHLIKCTLISVWNTVFVSSRATLNVDMQGHALWRDAAVIWRCTLIKLDDSQETYFGKDWLKLV